MKPVHLDSLPIQRRRDERKPLRADAEVRWPGQAPARVRTLDISASGIAVAAEVNPLSNTIVTICLAPPSRPRGPRSIEFQAVVVHSILMSKESGFRIGLRFQKLSTAALEAVMLFLHD